MQQLGMTLQDVKEKQQELQRLKQNLRAKMRVGGLPTNVSDLNHAQSEQLGQPMLGRSPSAPMLFKASRLGAPEPAGRARTPKFAKKIHETTAAANAALYGVTEAVERWNGVDSSY
jgi:hypothetical protein